MGSAEEPRGRCCYNCCATSRYYVFKAQREAFALNAVDVCCRHELCFFLQFSQTTLASKLEFTSWCSSLDKSSHPDQKWRHQLLSVYSKILTKCIFMVTLKKQFLDKCLTNFENVNRFGKGNSSASFRVMRVTRHFLLVDLENGVRMWLPSLMRHFSVLFKSRFLDNHWTGSRSVWHSGASAIQVLFCCEKH